MELPCYGAVVATVLRNAQRHHKAISCARSYTDAHKQLKGLELRKNLTKLKGVRTKPKASIAFGHGRWSRDQVEALVRYVQAQPEGARFSMPHALQHFGYDMASLSDKEKERFRDKLKTIRHMLRHGKNPLEPSRTNVAAPGTQHAKWRGWLRIAFEALPNRTGNVNDLAAALAADPVIAPQLDTRPNPRMLNVPNWKCGISWNIRFFPEMVRTGEKRGRQLVYRYDEEIAQQEQQRQAARAAEAKPSKRKRGLPLLGKAHR